MKILLNHNLSDAAKTSLTEKKNQHALNTMSKKDSCTHRQDQKLH